MNVIVGVLEIKICCYYHPMVKVVDVTGVVCRRDDILNLSALECEHVRSEQFTVCRNEKSKIPLLLTDDHGLGPGKQRK